MAKKITPTKTPNKRFISPDITAYQPYQKNLKVTAHHYQSNKSSPTETHTMTLTNDQRRNLKAQAHHLKPITQIGKNGVTPEQITTIKTHLENHQLIKIKFNDYKEQKQTLATQITQETQSEQIDLIGNTLIIYKQKTQ